MSEIDYPSERQVEIADILRVTKRQQTLAGILVAVLIHVLLGFVLALIVLPQFAPAPPELIISAPKAEMVQQPQKKTLNKFQRPERPSAPSSSAAKVIAASVTSPLAVPVVEATVDDALLGAGFGDGLGFGQGLGIGGPGGGGITFFGNKADGDRVAFVVDVSASMSNEQLALMKSELTRSLNGLPPGTQYQVIFFSGPVWFANQKIEGKGRNEVIVRGNRGKKLIWKSESGAAGGFEFGDGKEALPVEPWISANPSNLRRTIKHVEAARKSFGTSWLQPLRMALSMDPKPDIVYFMTDGAVRNAAEDVKLVTRLNRRGKSKTKIFTTAMMQPQAADHLYELAKKNGGEFSIVKADGSMVIGRDALK